MITSTSTFTPIGRRSAKLKRSTTSPARFVDPYSDPESYIRCCSHVKVTRTPHPLISTCIQYVLHETETTDTTNGNKTDVCCISISLCGLCFRDELRSAFESYALSYTDMRRQSIRVPLNLHGLVRKDLGNAAHPTSTRWTTEQYSALYNGLAFHPAVSFQQQAYRRMEISGGHETTSS